jgi:hydroxymethylbilane synthase
VRLVPDGTGEVCLQGDRIRIATRGSPLALAQAHEVRARLMAAHTLPETAFAIKIVKTTGDQILDRPLSEAGGKGLFTKEIEEALLAGEADLAVHSMKDMQTLLPEGLGLGAILPREDVRDAFISLKYASLSDMPHGAVMGTSSLRRHAQIKNIRPDLTVVQFRGNVQTRLKKLEDGVADATLLARAGLNRLGLTDRIRDTIDVGTMLPAVAQGAIGIEIRTEDERTAALIRPLNDEKTALAVSAERAFLARLEGSCRTPIAGLAKIEAGELVFSGQILSPDGKNALAVSRRGPLSRAAAIGDEAAAELLDRGARTLLIGST